MTMLTDEEQLRLLEELSKTTGKIRAGVLQVLQEHKITKIPEYLEGLLARSEIIERRLKARDVAEVRAWAAHASTLKANLKEEA